MSFRGLSIWIEFAYTTRNSNMVCPERIGGHMHAHRSRSSGESSRLDPGSKLSPSSTFRDSASFCETPERFWHDHAISEIRFESFYGFEFVLNSQRPFPSQLYPWYESTELGRRRGPHRMTSPQAAEGAGILTLTDPECMVPTG